MARRVAKFITWKRYGFRHVVKGRDDTLCGHGAGWHWMVEFLPEGFDPHGTDRPLCGTCRKIWKAETGQVLDG